MQNKSKVNALSQELVIEAEVSLPTEFCLFKFGETCTSKGTVYLEQKTAELCLLAWKDQGNDLPLDYEHQAIKTSNGPVPAAGWFKLEIKTDGLYAVNVEWTEKARELLSSREYRYYSPAFYTDPDNRVIEIINCALTNIPAIKDLKPLIASKLELQGEDMTAEELKAFLDECKIMINECLAAVPQLVGQALQDHMAQMEKEKELQEEVEVELAEITQEVPLPEECKKDEEIKKLSAQVEDLENQTLIAALMSHGADTTNSKRFEDLKVLSKLHMTEGQSIVEAVASFAKENADLFTAPKATTKTVDRKALNVLSKPVETQTKLSKFEQWKKATPSSASKFIGGK